MPSETRRKQLGELLIRRRIELDPRYENRRVFEAERWPGRYRQINKIETGQGGNFEPATVVAVELAYDLEPGAIGRFLDGSDLTPARPAVPRLAPVPDVPDEQVEPPYGVAGHAVPYAIPILKRLYELARAGNTSPAGADVFPRDQWWARRWDSRLEEEPWDVIDLAWTIAEVMARRASRGQRESGTG